MIKSLLVYATAQKQLDSAVTYSVGLAKEFEASLSAISCAFNPIYPTTTPMEVLGADFIGAARAENRKLASAAISRIESAAKSAAVSFKGRVVQATVADAASRLAEIARRSDLAVLRQPESDEWEGDQVVEAVLFGSGRPVIVVPYSYKEVFSLRSVLVCWDGSRASARAVGDAMPFLSRANQVFVVTVSDDEGQSSDDEMREYMGNHSVNAQFKRVSAVNGDEVAALLNFAADNGVDLIVMGGYGHSRIREFVLGGVTRGILASMTAPVLLSH